MPANPVCLTVQLLAAGLAVVAAPPARVAATVSAAAPSPAAAPVAAPSAPPAPATVVTAAPAAPVAAAATVSPIHPLRASVPAFGGAMEVEVRDLSREAADAAIQAAAVEVG
ncbi:MAG: hypothetical protein JOZ15_10525, partial [Acidobacteria bacterium]|nr:hypothetical protein [Acidobacteriota bacterium]